MLFGAHTPFFYKWVDDENTDLLYGKTSDGFLKYTFSLNDIGQRDRSIKGNDGYKWKKERRFTTGDYYSREDEAFFYWPENDVTFVGFAYPKP